MASKYKKLKNKLPAYQEDPVYQDKVDKWKADYTKLNKEPSLAVLVTHIEAIEAEKEQLKSKERGLNVALAALEQLTKQHMDNLDLDKARLGNGRTVFLGYEIYPAVKDKERVLNWAEENNMRDSLSIQWQTLRGICNEAALNGQAFPDGVECYIKTKVSVRQYE